MYLKIRPWGTNSTVAFILILINKKSITYIIQPDINKDMLTKEDVISVMRFLEKEYNYR